MPGRAYGKRKSMREAEEQTDLIIPSSPGPFVYFTRGYAPQNHKAYIYIGYSAGDKFGRSKHVETGEVLAVIRADKVHETLLHNYFAKSRAPKGTFHSNDWFDAAAVEPYILRLLRNNYAVPDEMKLHLLGNLPWELWGPAFTQDRPRGFFTVCEEYKAKLRDTFQTPLTIVHAAQTALGGQIDLDPATSFEAQNRMEQGGCGPTYSYCEHNNGLALPWYPRVFLNPPYGNLTKTFTTKLVKEINDKNVTEAVVVLSLEHVTTSWFKNMHRACLPNVAWAIPYERISFIKPNTAGTQADSPITGNLIMYYGEHKQRFWKAFQDIAYSIQMAELI